MDRQDLLCKLESVLEKARTGVLATTNAAGQAHLRWMTPTLIHARPGALYAITLPDSPKVQDLEDNPRVEWLIQTPNLTEIVNLRGIAQVIDNPALKAEVVESVGRHLTTFWKVNPDRTEFVVLETLIVEARYFQPMAGTRQTVRFREEAGK